MGVMRAYVGLFRTDFGFSTLNCIGYLDAGFILSGSYDGMGQKEVVVRGGGGRTITMEDPPLI